MKKIYILVVIVFSLSIFSVWGHDVQVQDSYMGIFRPFNNSLAGFLPTGKIEVKVVGDSISIKTYLDDDSRVFHIQSIHVGSRCPELWDDKNKDGLVDIEESYKVVGKVLIKLDSDLIAQTGIYPIGGGFTYNEEASLSKLESEVRARTEENLNLVGRVVLIHGVSMGAKIPETVATRDGYTKQSSIPIACAILAQWPAR